MSWSSLENFFAMGGYAPYVWGSYAVTLAAIVLEIWALRARRKRAVEEVRRAGLDAARAT
ncbi:MAG TPA: heme exporter protein CcmD [Burkholderiaceae bacterium]|nr:heme exporter protein CcmD [Burkholderiaceae bacterium]